MDKTELKTILFYVFCVCSAMLIAGIVAGMISFWAVDPVEEENWANTAALLGIVGLLGACVSGAGYSDLD